MLENQQAAATHIATLKQSKKEKLENGGYSEYANMLVSIFNSEHVNNMENNQWRGNDVNNRTTIININYN